MTLTFREAAEADLPVLVSMLVDDDISQTSESGVLDVYKRAFADIGNEPNNRVLVAEQDGELVAMLELYLLTGLSRGGAKRAMVDGVRVASRLRGQGLGSQLMRHAIDEARRAGCQFIQVTSDIRRRRAHLFYRRLGFEPTHYGFRQQLT